MKISTFALKVVFNIIPSLVNLAKRYIIQPRDTIVQYAKHMLKTILIFFECRSTAKVWMACLRWFGNYSALHNECSTNFVQFFGLVYCSPKNKVLWEIIWFYTLWSLWLMRSQVILNSKRPSVDEILDLIKLRS